MYVRTEHKKIFLCSLKQKISDLLEAFQCNRLTSTFSVSLNRKTYLYCIQFSELRRVILITVDTLFYFCFIFFDKLNPKAPKSLISPLLDAESFNKNAGKCCPMRKQIPHMKPSGKTVISIHSPIKISSFLAKTRQASHATSIQQVSGIVH